MKKIFVLLSMILVMNTANAQIGYYASVKAGAGATTFYVNDDDKLGDYLVKDFKNNGLNVDKYTDSGLLWEMTASVGVDWAPSNMYVKQNPYDWFHLRLEGEFGYNSYHEDGDLKYDYMTTGSVKLKQNYFFALANGYADFRIDNFIPYIGAGIGYGFGNEEVKVKYESQPEISNSADDNGIIYALHCGAGYVYSDKTTLELGFRRVYMPLEDDGMNIFDSVRLGVRFRI